MLKSSEPEECPGYFSSGADSIFKRTNIFSSGGQTRAPRVQRNFPYPLKNVLEHKNRRREGRIQENYAIHEIIPTFFNIVRSAHPPI